MTRFVRNMVLNYLKMSVQEIEDHVACGGLDDDMFFDLHSSATGQIRALKEMLQWYVDEDEINEGDPENEYWIDGKNKAIALLEVH